MGSELGRELARLDHARGARSRNGRVLRGGGAGGYELSTELGARPGIERLVGPTLDDLVDVDARNRRGRNGRASRVGQLGARGDVVTRTGRVVRCRTSHHERADQGDDNQHGHDREPTAAHSGRVIFYRARHHNSPRATPRLRRYSSSLSAATNASWGTSTRPICFIRFLPSFWRSSSLRLRVMSPP